jgi:hypothetical protein
MSSFEELQDRLNILQPLAGRLQNDERAQSTKLEMDDPLVRTAEEGKAYIPEPLTIGTLAASVLGAVESIKIAIRDVERNMHPGGDV